MKCLSSCCINCNADLKLNVFSLYNKEREEVQYGEIYTFDFSYRVDRGALCP